MLQNDRMFMNPNLNITRISTGLSRILSHNLSIRVDNSSPMNHLKPAAVNRVGQPKQNKITKRHKRSHSEQENINKKSKTIDVSINIQNLTKDTSQNNSSGLVGHKRAISKDQSRKIMRKLPRPLLNNSLIRFTKKGKRMMTQLEPVEDTEERNSTSQCTSVQQNNLLDRNKIKVDLKNRPSRDFFQEVDEDVTIGLNGEEVNFDQKNPFGTIMEPQIKDKSEPSALNLNESEFDFYAEGHEIIERDDTFSGNQPSFKQEFSQSINNQSEIINEPQGEISGFLNKSNIDALKEKYCPDNEFGQIDEVNENSSSVYQYSNEESKKNSSNKKPALKTAKTGGEEDPELSKFLSSVDDINDIPFESPKVTLKNQKSDPRDILQNHNKFSFKLKPIEKVEETSFDLELRNSKGENARDSGNNKPNELGMNTLLDMEKKASSSSSNKVLENSIRVSHTLNDVEKLKQLKSKLSNISRIEGGFQSNDVDPRFTFQNNRNSLYKNAKETFELVVKGSYHQMRDTLISSRRGSSIVHKGDFMSKVPLSFGKRQSLIHKGQVSDSVLSLYDSSPMTKVEARKMNFRK